MKKYFKILAIMFMHTSIIQASWARIAEQPQSGHQTYQQTVANSASARLAALKENRTKHAEIAKEAAKNQYPKNTNFETVSAQKQAILDQPAQQYFFSSWFRPTENSKPLDPKKLQLTDNSKPIDNNSHPIKNNQEGLQLPETNQSIETVSNTTDENQQVLQLTDKSKQNDKSLTPIQQHQQALQLFVENKPAIKENYRLANKLADAQTTKNTLQDATSITIPTNPLSLPSFVSQALKLGSNKGSQTLVDQAYYKKIADKKTGTYEVKRSGISNYDSFVAENSSETVHEYADRYTASNNAIKPTDPAALKNQLAKENSILANKVIPNEQIGLPGIYNLGVKAFDSYKHNLNNTQLLSNNIGAYSELASKYINPQKN